MPINQPEFHGQRERSTARTSTFQGGFGRARVPVGSPPSAQPAQVDGVSLVKRRTPISMCICV